MSRRSDSSKGEHGGNVKTRAKKIICLKYLLHGIHGRVMQHWFDGKKLKILKAL